MPIKITAKHCELSEALTPYMQRKAEGLRKYFDNIIDIEIVFSQEKSRVNAELGVKVNGGYLVSKGLDFEGQAAFDQALTKMERQLLKHKNKICGNKKHIKVQKGELIEEPILD